MKNAFSQFLAAIWLLMVASIAYSAEWETTGEWVVKNGDRYFPLGLWPTLSMTTDDFRLFDMVYVHRPVDYVPETMSGKTLMIGSSLFQWVFSAGYDGSIPGYETNRDTIIDYREMQALKRVDAGLFERYIDRTVLQPWNATVDTAANPDFCWFTVDEPDHFGFGRRTWCWDPELIRRMSHAVKISDDRNDLVIVSFGPPKKGNVYFYDANIPPLNPPPLSSQFPEGYELNYDKTKGEELNPYNYFENIRHTVSAYRETGDVWMLNDYHTFFQTPEYAGIAVDAIRASIITPDTSDSPVWLWFNPGLIDYHSSYGMDKFRCQIFTAIAHGCSGIFMFCTDNSDYIDQLSMEEWRIAEQILADLNDRRGFLQGLTVQQGVLHDYSIHYSIRNTDTGMVMLITNTSNRSITVDPGEIDTLADLPDTLQLAPYSCLFLTVIQ